MNKTTHYLDYAASAPMKPAVCAAMHEAMTLEGNPSSVHGFGRAARAKVEEARKTIADVMEVKPAEVVFTGSATEANVTVMNAFPGRPIICSAIEHSSIIQTATTATLIRTRPDGLIDLAHLQECLKQAGNGAVVSMMLVNNETGVVQPVAEAAKIAKAHGALIHCDAAQALGRTPFSRQTLGVDMLSLSAHKCGGPQGVGALVVREGLSFAPLLTGGGQEMRRRSGTENVAGIIGFGVAVSLAGADITAQSNWAAWRDSFENAISKAAPASVFFGRSAPRVGNISCLAMQGVKNETQLMAFDLAGYGVSAGSACSSGKMQPSHVLKAMGADETLTGCAIRVSFGWKTEKAALEGLAKEWLLLYSKKNSAAA